MKTKRFFSRIGLIAVSALLLLSILATALPQTVQAASALPSGATATMWLKNGRIYIQTSGFKEQTKYKVRTKDASLSQPKFHDLGYLITKPKTTQTFSYAIPKALKNTLWIDVCMKSQINNALYCQKLFNPNL